MTAPAEPAGIDTVLGKNSALIRKGLNGGVLLARWPSAPIIENLAADAGQIVVPTDYESIGHMGEDGLSTAVDEELADVPAWGSSSFVRRDIQRRDIQITVNGLETRRRTLEMYHGLDLSGTEMSAMGEWIFDHPSRPPSMYWRVLTLAVDGQGDSQYIMASFYPRMFVTERDDYTQADGEDPASFPCTLSTVADDEAGFNCRQFIFGPGALAQAEAMGVTVAAAAGA